MFSSWHVQFIIALKHWKPMYNKQQQVNNINANLKKKKRPKTDIRKTENRLKWNNFFVVVDLHAPRAVFNLKRLVQLQHCRTFFM